MALLEEDNCCCVCERGIYYRAPIPLYYCVGCFADHRAEILANAPWVAYLANAEKQRRKRRNRLLAQKIVFRTIPTSALPPGVYS